MSKAKYRYRGGIHIHTIFSDGSGNIDTISRAAKKSGLDWIIISDHNCLDAEEGIFNGVYVFKINEVSSCGANHYLTFGLNECVNPNQGIQDIVNEVRKKGGFGFAAHPDESDKRKNKHLPIKWLDKNVIPDGVEIWNWFSEWANNLNDRSIFGLIYAYLFKYNLVTKPSERTLAWWDELNNKSKYSVVPAIGGIDAHALKVKQYIIPVTIFPYRTMFKTIINCINLKEPLSDDFNKAKIQVFEAIKNGNNIVINSHVDNSIPNFSVENSLNEVQAGESISLNNQTYLNVQNNKKRLIKVLHNGKEIYNTLAKQLKLLITEKGNYRIEIMHKGKGFAYSNPILVG